MKTNFFIWFKNISEGWKFFGAIVGFSTIIWTVALKVDHWKDKGINQDNVIEYLKASDQTQIIYNEIKDSIDILKWTRLDFRLIHISDSIKLSLDNQQILTNAVGTLGSKITNTVPQLFKLMGGLKFELVQDEVMRQVFPKTEIKIIKIDTLKK